MDNSLSGQLFGSEIHGFHTLQELDVASMREEAKARWLRPNEIHAILCNYKYFGVRVKPVHLPESGNIVLFDRKVLRNFRKDGHNWKKKNDGKTVKEAHEHLKVGNEERIHVYYAHGQDKATFVRRCYWLLDKSLEHIVLVHYRETKEGSPSTPVNSSSCSVSDLSPPWVASEELDSRLVNAYGGAASEPLERTGSLSLRQHEKKLYEINTLEWDELLGSDLINESILPISDKDFVSNQQNQLTVNGSQRIADPLASCTLSTEMTALGCSSEQTAHVITAQDNQHEGFSNPVLCGQVNSIMESKDISGARADESLATAVNDCLEHQGSFERWIHSIMVDTPGSVHDPSLGPTISSVQDFPQSQSADNQQSQVPEHSFEITAVSPLWAYATEETKILVTGFFRQDCQYLSKSNLLCVCGDVSVPVEVVQPGVYNCLVPQHSPGLVNFYMSIEGRKPISQVLNFEYRTPLSYEPVAAAEDQYKWEEFETQMRLARLLFSTSKGLQVLSSKVSLSALREAKKFARKTASILNSWAYLIKLIENGRATFTQARDRLLEITLKNRLREWLLEKIMEGCKTTEYDKNGQGVIHLCAILGYTWAVDLFSWSGLSLDFRDKHGWTALHWAAYCGRQKMVAVLLTAGAKPNLVTDPTPENPGGCTAADLASMTGFDGLAAYLSEMALVSQFKDMILAGNARDSMKTNTADSINNENLSEDQLYMKDALVAYKTAAEAAGLIHSAMRERAFRLRSDALHFSNPEDEARHVVAAMKIQHAFRKYGVKKKMSAAAHIQCRFRTWKLRKEFLNMRRQAIKIQAAFRAFRTRKQYRKILWSVGIIDKAILRWRLKRKGFRGLQVNQEEAMENEREQSDVEEEFFRISQKQAEERVERAVVTVQSLFRSKKAQEEYRRMKLAHNQALLEYEGFLDP